MGVAAAEGGGVEPQWLIGPLSGVTGRVQYPLATPSRLRPVDGDVSLKMPRCL